MLRKSLAALSISGALLPEPVLGAEPTGGDGQPDEIDTPAPVATDPVVIALNGVSLCGAEADGGDGFDLASHFQDISVEMLLLAMENAEFRRPYLANALRALAAIGSSQDLEYVLGAAEDISWAYLGDAIDEDTEDAAVLEKQAQIAARIRADVIWTWGQRGDLPDQTLIDALWDSDNMVSSRAVFLALGSDNDSVRAEAIEVCAINEEVAAEDGLCPTDEI